VHSSSIAYNWETGVYTVTGKNEEFRILQLTDTHICASISTIGTDRKVFDACYALIKEAQPDLIIVTGDLVFPIPLHTFGNDNLKAIGQFCKFMDHIGIPWAMVYGNHDTEIVAKYSAQELSGLYRYYADEANSVMLYADHQPDVYGRYNQYLRIENSDHSLNRIIFLVDSNDYVKGTGKINEYDSVHPDQIQWYEETIDKVCEEEGRQVSSFVFMHIPFRAFADAQEALKNNSSDAVYLFGENGEEVCHPDFDSGFFDVILKKGSTQAVFIGHDHLNNMAVRYKGIDLVYSKSIDYIAYPGISRKTAQRGATLIVLSQDGTYRLEQLHYTK
jgi:3',5'-cyclic AMP phosphodiesterase CpdA